MTFLESAATQVGSVFVLLVKKRIGVVHNRYLYYYLFFTSGCANEYTFLFFTLFIQRSLATDLQTLSMDFRKQQKGYLNRLQRQQEVPFIPFCISDFCTLCIYSIEAICGSSILGGACVSN